MTVDERPLVSVIISSYNYGRYLRESIDSVLAQTWDRLEVIVVDDGSTDTSAEIIRSYQDRLIPVFKTNGGQASALNTGFACSRGDVICLMDADDVWFPEKISAVIAVLRDQPDVSWVCHRMELTDEDLRPIGVVLPSMRYWGRLPRSRYLYLERMIRPPTPSLCFRRPLAERLFPIPESPLPHDRDNWPATVAFDPDAYLIACCGADESGNGYAIEDVLGIYRRRRAVGAADDAMVRRILVRQIGVERRASSAWSEWAGRRAVSTTVFKHEMIIATLDGRRLLSPLRIRSLCAGVRGCLTLARRDPRLAVRQGAALILSFIAPGVWLRRYVHHKLI